MQVVIGLGSNIEPESNIPAALRVLDDEFGVLRQSMLLVTKAIGAGPAPDFHNTAVLVHTRLALPALRQRLRDIECSMGRRRTADRNAPREIDLDVLVVDDEIIDEDVRSRDFLRSAVAELAPRALQAPPESDAVPGVADRPFS